MCVLINVTDRRIGSDASRDSSLDSNTEYKRYAVCAFMCMLIQICVITLNYLYFFLIFQNSNWFYTSCYWKKVKLFLYLVQWRYQSQDRGQSYSFHWWQCTGFFEGSWWTDSPWGRYRFRTRRQATYFVFRTARGFTKVSLIIEMWIIEQEVQNTILLTTWLYLYF